MKLSRQTKEIIQTVAVLLLVAALILLYIVYPMSNVKDTMGRSDGVEYTIDSLPPNEATAWIELGWAPDTLRVETDGLTNLAVLYATPNHRAIDSTDTTSTLPPEVPDDSLAGTVILLHGDGQDRDSVIAWAPMFLNNRHVVVAYDQRASGRTTGAYRGEGRYEADDLDALISWLDLRGMIKGPLSVVGRGLGAEAAILAAQEDQRIEKVIAIEPYLSSEEMLHKKRQDNGIFWFPLYNTVTWFWYEMRSSYAAPYRDNESIEGVGCQTVIVADAEALQGEAIARLKEASEAPWFSTQELFPNDEAGLQQKIFGFIAGC